VVETSQRCSGIRPANRPLSHGTRHFVLEHPFRPLPDIEIPADLTAQPYCLTNVCPMPVVFAGWHRWRYPRWQRSRARFADLRVATRSALPGPQVEVSRNRLGHQRISVRIAELLPPGREIASAADAVVADGRDQLDFAGVSGRSYSGTRTSAQPKQRRHGTGPRKGRFAVISCDPPAISSTGEFTDEWAVHVR